MKEGFSKLQLMQAQTLPELVEFAAFGVLPGEKQTVPRGELYAILEALVNLMLNAKAAITTDSKVNADLYRDGKTAAVDSTNGDLWSDVFEVIESKNLQIDIVWSKGHPNEEALAKYSISYKQAFGNVVADALAQRGAKENMMLEEDRFAVKWHLDLVHRIQQRAVVILSAVCSRCRNVRTLSTTQATMPQLSSAAHAMQSSHTITALGRSLFCSKCHQRSAPGAQAARSWLATMCSPNRILQATYTAGTVRPSRIPPNQAVRVGHRTVHPSHDLMVHQGLHFCRKCGAFASKRLLSLAEQCDPTGKSPQDAERKRKAVISLLRGELPRGVKAFPNSSAKLQSQSSLLLQ